MKKTLEGISRLNDSYMVIYRANDGKLRNYMSTSKDAKQHAETNNCMSCWVFNRFGRQVSHVWKDSKTGKYMQQRKFGQGMNIFSSSISKLATAIAGGVAV